MLDNFQFRKEQAEIRKKDSVKYKVLERFERFKNNVALYFSAKRR